MMNGSLYFMIIFVDLLVSCFVHLRKMLLFAPSKFYYLMMTNKIIVAKVVIIMIIMSKRKFIQSYVARAA